ncbi:MAG: hypothetical protein P4L71_11515 [Acetobacteraceae bacterium]|nr:hypothetical protein [Acetobacteraceae bacterium]
MSKILILAAALLTLGMGAAFANDTMNARLADASPMPRTATMATTDTQVHVHLYPTAVPRSTVWVYDQFAPSGTTQGGQN